MTPEEIINRFRQSDKNIMVVIYNQLLPNITKLLAKNKAVESADDLLWEGIEIFWEKCQNPDFSLNGSPKSYIHNICKNKLYDRFKSKGQLSEMLSVLSFLPGPSEGYADLWALVERELLTMSKTCREIINLFRETDNYDIITQQLGITYENARYRRSNCLAELRRRIENK